MLGVLSEYQISVNQYFLVLIISGAIVATLIFINILYYMYIEKSMLIIYSSFYFLFMLVSLVLSSILILSATGQIKSSYQRFLYSLDILNHYILLYFLFLIMTTFIKKPLESYKKGFLLALPVLSIIGYYMDYQWLTFFIYLYSVIISTIYFLFIEIKSHSTWRLTPALILILLPVFYYTFYFVADVDLSVFFVIDGIISFFIVIISLVYFMIHYKQVIKDKDQLYTKLIRDMLTGLYSKGYLLEQVSTSEKGVFLFLDINNFKWLNDNHGHVIGDRLLVEFSESMRSTLDSSLVISRFGGDEFILFSTNTSIESAQQLAIHVISIFKECTKTVLEDDSDGLGISIGISAYSNFDSHRALIQSDKAMYKAKNSGNYKIVVDV